MIRKRSLYIPESEVIRDYGKDLDIALGIQVRFKYRTKTTTSLQKNGYTIEQEHKIYDAVCDDILKNTRWYLDNLEFISEFQVSWEEYGRKHYQRDWIKLKRAKLKAQNDSE